MIGSPNNGAAESRPNDRQRRDHWRALIERKFVLSAQLFGILRENQNAAHFPRELADYVHSLSHELLHHISRAAADGSHAPTLEHRIAVEAIDAMRSYAAKTRVQSRPD